MTQIVGPPAHVIRNKPISAELRELLAGAADAAGVTKISIVSGGQVSNHVPALNGAIGGWTGSHRHDDGRAADIELMRDETVLSFTDKDGSQVAAFVTEVAARGAIGIGAGVNYMGPRRIHVGYGNTLSDQRQLVWGAAGSSANAPEWLRVAAKAGWGRSANLALATNSSPAIGYFVVAARDGLWLRRGPGLEFERSRLLAVGTVLVVDGIEGNWSRVDVAHDGLVDGYVCSSFLRPVESDHGLGEVSEEPASEGNALL